MRLLFILLLFLTPLSLKAEPRHPLLLIIDFFEWLQVQEQKECHCCRCDQCHCHEYAASKKMKKRSKQAAQKKRSTPYAG